MITGPITYKIDVRTSTDPRVGKRWRAEASSRDAFADRVWLQTEVLGHVERALIALAPADDTAVAIVTMEWSNHPPVIVARYRPGLVNTEMWCKDANVLSDELLDDVLPVTARPLKDAPVAPL